MSASLMAALGAVAGEGVAGVIRSTFDCMGVAEEEIAAARKRHPAARDRRSKRGQEIAARIHASFKILCPSEVLRGFASTGLYRAHARELIDRVARGEDTRPGTKAEVLAMMSRTSLDAPLNRDGMAVMTRLFVELFPAEARTAFAGMNDFPAAESWDGAAEEMMRECARKLAQADRVL